MPFAAPPPLADDDEVEDVVLLESVARHVFAGVQASTDGALPRTLPLDDIRELVRALARPDREGR